MLAAIFFYVLAEEHDGGDGNNGEFWAYKRMEYLGFRFNKRVVWVSK